MPDPTEIEMYQNGTNIPNSVSKVITSRLN